jgi:dienelactone hydrolase
MIDVAIAVDAQRIAGKLLLPPGCRGRCPAVLFVHGWGGSQRRGIGKSKRIVTRGYACLTFNLRGHARTAGQRDRVTRGQNLRDIIAAYDLLVAQPEVDAAHVVVVGSSYGGYLATLLTNERKVRALALRAPALYKDEDFDRPKRQLNLDPDLCAYRRRALAPSDNMVLAAASRFEGDVLIAESERDTVIPHPVIDNYVRAFGAAGSVRHEVLDGDHALSSEASRRAWGALLLGWLLERVPPPARLRAVTRRAGRR